MHYIYVDDVSLWYCGPDTTHEPADSMIIPNVFTPNGDGYNDKFVYKHQEQWTFETSVYNRWGDLVFHDSISQNWDGTINGNPASEGTYFYIIRSEAISNGEKKVYNGVVQLLR